MTHLRVFLLFLGLACLIPGVAQAAESSPVVSKRATVTLVSEADRIAPGTTVQLGLRFQLAPDWHTYGRNPGDAGLAPELNWALPPGATVGDIAWPTPQRLPEGPLMTFGYTGTMMLVAPLATTAGLSGPVRLHASWLVCQNICVPEEGDFSLDLPAGTTAASPQAAFFTQAEAALPRPSPFEARISPTGTLSLSGGGLQPASVNEAWFIPDTPDRIAPAGKQILSHTDDVLLLALPIGDGFKATDTQSGVLVLRDASGLNTALSISAHPGDASPSPPTSLLRAIGFALVGGLLLNLMPCVFPVLAMKAMAIAKLSSAARGMARAHAASYTAGVMLSFAALGIGVLMLRQFGIAVGWGFQFQSPAFVAAMTWVLFAVGLNLSGVFGVGGQVVGTGQNLTLRGGHTGSFFSGTLAVLVATPCTAPFMGVALAAALAAPPIETIAVFLAMGAGLAAPTALLAIVPGVSRLLPRPGHWMGVFKQVLAFPMYAACAWLVWVISIQAGAFGVLASASGLVLVGFAAWALRFGRRLGWGLALVAGLAALALLPGLVTSEAPSAETVKAEMFDPQRLASLRTEGRPVFINMTAAWCVTCLVNERVALSTMPVRRAFSDLGVTVMKGDWTRPDPEISRFLKAQGRDGVPLYVFYPPGGKPPVILPQLLTQASVLDTLAPYAVAGRP